MKHPALARVFSVVLAILSLLLLVSGIRSFGKNADENKDRLAYEEKFAGRIESYREAQAELAGSADFDETMRALRVFVEEHERSAAKHKTDTAIYSSTKGGLRMGEGLIETAQAEIYEIRDQLRDTEARKVFLESLLSELIASNKSQLPWLDALANRAAAFAVDCYTSGAHVGFIAGRLRALAENEPTPASVAAVYTPPEAPELFAMPALPDLSGISYGNMQGSYEEAMAQAAAAASAYEQAAAQYVRQMQEYYDNAARAQAERLERIQAQQMGLVSDAACSAQYRLAHDAWEKECRAVRAELDIGRPAAEIRRLSKALEALVRQADSASPGLTGETGGVFPGLDALTTLCDAQLSRLEGLAASAVTQMSNEDFLALTDGIAEVLDMLGDAFRVIAANLDNPASMIAEILEKLGVVEALLPYLESMLDKAELQMQVALEELWYQLGETEKKALKLEAEKLGLDSEAALLTKRTLEANEMKELKSRHTKLRLFLLNVPEIKSASTGDDDLADCARAWLDTYGQETFRLYRMRILLGILAVCGGLMGLLGIFAAYELVKKRVLLIAPVLVCLICAAVAATLSAALNLGQMYVALVTAVFALIQLLIVLPKKKKPGYQPRHMIA